MGKKKMLMRKFGSVAVVNNTFISGVASVINTPALLADKLEYYPSGASFSENDIQNFTINGSDIECYIGVDYQTKGGAFYVGIPEWTYGAILTHFKHTDSFLKYINGNTFIGQINIIDFNLNSVVDIGGNAFQNTNVKIYYLPNCLTLSGSNSHFALCSNAEIIYLPKCVNYGSTVIYNNVFDGVRVGCKIYAEPTMQTINSGSEEGDLAYARNSRGADIRYVTSFTQPNQITDLAVNTVYATAIKLDWSVPTSTNAIDYYEVYVDGVFYKNSSTNDITVFGLTNLQTYNFSVIAVDIFYNKSEMSNVVTQQINGVGREWLDNVISYYKFENNVLDSVGTNNGVATDIAYESGKVGNAAVFNGSTSFINCGNATNLQSYPISIVSVIKTSNAGSGYRGLVVKQFNYGLYLDNNVLIYYDWDTTTPKSTGVNLADNNYHTVIKTIDALGNVNIYVDAVLVLTDTITLVNTNEDLVIGAGLSDGSIQNFNGSMDDTSLLNKELSQAEVTEIDVLLMAGFPLI